MIIAKSYATRTRGIIVNYPPHIPYYLEEYELCFSKFCLDEQRMVRVKIQVVGGFSSYLASQFVLFEALQP